MPEIMQDVGLTSAVMEKLAINLVIALLVLVLGWMGSSLVGRSIQRLVARSPRIDPTILPMVLTVTVWAIRLFVIIAVLARFGIQTASIITVLGAAGLAIGLALQGTLQNIAAGIMLLVLRPMRAGEFVSVVGKGDGTVAEVGLFLTRLIQSDGIHISLPNSLVWGNPIINYSRNKTRRLDIEVGVQHGDNIELALSELRQLVVANKLLLSDPKPMVMVTEYRESTTIITIRAWAEVTNYWEVRFDLYRTALQTLNNAGLKAPVPVRVMQMSEPVTDTNVQ
ncbi:mechanosensitive ion channel family protein [Alcaligenaceae bacterium]|nr:mechanosensitive ion channel family protein [Alcaligenaceae bacterium]